MVGALSAPQIPAPQPNPFEQAVIQAAQAAKQHGHEPPKTSITISTPTPSGPNATGAIPMPKPPAAPQFSQAPIPGAAGGPGQPTVPAGPTTQVNPQLLDQVAASQAQSTAANDAITKLLAQQPPPPTPYQAPAMPKAPPGQDLGNLLGALLFRQAGPAFAKQANSQQAQRDKQHAEDIAAAKEAATGSVQSAQLAGSAWNDKLTALRAQAQQGDAHAKALVDEYDREEHNAALEAAKNVKLAQEATKLADNREKFSKTFGLGLANLGFKESQFTTQEADRLATQAAQLTAKYYGYGLRADTAYSVAQLRSATQMTISDSHIVDADNRATANNQVRLGIANNRDLQETSRGALNYITGWQKQVDLLPSGSPERKAALDAMQRAMGDPSSPVGRAMTALKQNGLYGESVGDLVKAGINADLTGQMAGTTGGTVINQTFNQGPAAAAPAAAATIPPAGAGGLPPTKVNPANGKTYYLHPSDGNYYLTPP